MLIPGTYYTRKDIYAALQVPEEKQGGDWNTGYTQYDRKDFFIFANLGVAGRTGHDYNNDWKGDLLHWEGKTGSHIGQSQIQRMLKPDAGIDIHLLYRNADREKFYYPGKVRAVHVEEASPVKIIWQLIPENESAEPLPPTSEKTYWEGEKRLQTVNRYERDPEGRRRCLEEYGAICQVCYDDMEKLYGELGRGFIHIHHIKKLSDQGAYQLEPLKDLVPVCPNCHSIIHRKKEAMDYLVLREIVKERKRNLR